MFKFSSQEVFGNETDRLRSEFEIFRRAMDQASADLETRVEKEKDLSANALHALAERLTTEMVNRSLESNATIHNAMQEAEQELQKELRVMRRITKLKFKFLLGIQSAKFSFGNFSYMFGPNRISFTECQEYCSNLGGFPVEFGDTSPENEKRVRNRFSLSRSFDKARRVCMQR